MDPELRNKIEAILFASGKGVSESELVLFCEAKEKDIKKVIASLKEEYDKRESSLSISEHNNKWKLTVKSKYTPYVQKLVSETELPGPILKTLAVVAYKSPVLQSDIINMRGQGAYDHIKGLVKEKFITKEEHGRSYILKITDKFYEYFDVEGDEEIREVFRKLREQQQKVGNLTVIEDETQPGEAQKKLGDLDVVDSDPLSRKDHEEIFDKEVIKEVQKPIVKHRTDEEKQEEEDFLKKMDEQLSAVSKNITEHKLPERQHEEQKLAEEATTSEAIPSNTTQEKTEHAQKEEEITNPLETLEELAKKQSQQEDDEEEFI